MQFRHFGSQKRIVCGILAPVSRREHKHKLAYSVFPSNRSLICALRDFAEPGVCPTVRQSRSGTWNAVMRGHSLPGEFGIADHVIAIS